MPGPPPKRSSQRRRRNKPAKPVETASGAAVVSQPKPNSKWHPVAKRWFSSLGESGQSKFYEPSDWATAYVTAESMSREFRSDGPVSAAWLASFLKSCSSLLVSEADRRRVSLELERPSGEEGDAGVSGIDDARRRLRSAG